MKTAPRAMLVACAAARALSGGGKRGELRRGLRLSGKAGEVLSCNCNYNLVAQYKS